jgi:hypothetical protein
MPANPEALKALCYAEDGSVKPRLECRTDLINHLILDEMVDVDEAEDLADATMTELGLWEALTAEQDVLPESTDAPTA